VWERTERRFHDAVEGEPLNPRRTLDLHLPRHQKRADFQVRCRLRLAPFSMACGPWRLKSVPSASKKSLFNDLRVASNDPPGFRKRTDFILSTDDRRPYCLPRRGNRGLMQHRKEPPLIASLYR